MDRAVAVAQHQLPMAVFYQAGTAQMAQQALALVQRDSHDEGRLLPQYAKAVYFEENDYEAARDACTQVMAIAQRGNDLELELCTLANSVELEIYHGIFQESLEMCLRALELARRADNPWVEMGVQTFVAVGLLMTGDLQGAKPRLESLRNLAESLRGRHSLTNAFLRVHWPPSSKAIGTRLAIFPARACGIVNGTGGACRIACIWSWSWVN